MTMAFAIVALSAVNLGIVMRREREPPWSSPMFPYLGWIMLGWALTWAGGRAQHAPTTPRHRVAHRRAVARRSSALSIVAPALVGIDKAIQLSRQNKARDQNRRDRVEAHPRLVQ